MKKALAYRTSHEMLHSHLAAARFRPKAKLMMLSTPRLCAMEGGGNLWTMRCFYDSGGTAPAQRVADSEAQQLDSQAEREWIDHISVKWPPPQQCQL